MYVKHLAADMRLHRARHVLGLIESTEHEYLDSVGTRLIVRPPPPETPLLAKEAIRGCREALDDLALSLVVASRRAPRSTTFPIAPDAHAYLAEESRCLRHANQEARRAARSVTPWQGGDDVLWDLHQLDLTEDLVIGLGQVVELAPTRVPSPLNVLQPGLEATRAWLPLSDGSPVVPSQGPLQLVLTYGDPAVVRPLVATVASLISHVADTIDRVVSAAEHRGTPV